jgi:hypothetical protein
MRDARNARVRRGEIAAAVGERAVIDRRVAAWRASARSS